MSLLHNGRKVNNFIEITLTFSGFFECLQEIYSNQ